MPRGELALAAARAWIGTPFHWEASLKGVGVDCRGLLTGAARDCGFPEAEALEANLVGYSRQIVEAELVAGLDKLFDRKWHDRSGSPTPAPLDQLQPGDVLAFRIRGKMQHLGIYGGDGVRHSVIHAYSGEPAQALEMPLGRFWLGRLAGVWRWREAIIGD